MATLADFAAVTATIRNGLVYLAGCCDGASSFDDAGFSKFDSGPGHDFARRISSEAEFSVKQYAYMGKLCTKYRRQLLNAGITAEDIEAVKAFVAAATAGEIEAAPKAKAEAAAKSEYFLTNGRCIGGSDKAVHVRFCNGASAWVPRSQIKPGTEFGSVAIDFAVKAWIAEKNGFPAAPALAAYEAPAPVRRAATVPAPVTAPASRPRAPRTVHIVE